MDIDAVDLLVNNAYVVTMDQHRRVLANGAVASKDGVIVAVGPHRDVVLGVDAARTIDAHGALVHPGFIDNHVHLDYHNIRWACRDGADWEEAIPVHGDYMKIVDYKAEYVASKLAALEMAQNGTTCFLEAGGVMETDAAATAIE